MAMTEIQTDTPFPKAMTSMRGGFTYEATPVSSTIHGGIYLGKLNLVQAPPSPKL